MDLAPLRLQPPGTLEAIDQTLLPLEERWLQLRTLDAVCEAIKALRVRGAPLLGLVGAAGLAVAANERATATATLEAAAAQLIATRPTAVDLAFRTREALHGVIPQPEHERLDWLWAHAEELLDARRREDLALGAAGAELLAPYPTILTHCNAGALATGGHGTALAVVHCAFQAGTLERCFATETRPLLQGARLTAWELQRAGIPVTLLPDTAGASLLASGQVAAVVTGADRIARNGDTANKIGTYQLALAAHEHGIPFYIAAPSSTFDLQCPDGAAIPIEYRSESEVGSFGATRFAPAGIDAYNPAFDVTPARLITAFITERGILHPPFAG